MGRAAPRVNRKSVPFLAGWPSRSSQLEIDGGRYVKRASMVRRTETQRKPGLDGGYKHSHQAGAVQWMPTHPMVL
jgi:hypothetical protein